MSLTMPKLGLSLGKKATFDQKKLRGAFGQFKTGVIIATGSHQGFLSKSKEFINQADFGGTFLKDFIAKIAPAASSFASNKKLQIFKSIDLFIKNRVFEKDLVVQFKKLFSNQLCGMTINSFTSVSLSPPLVSFCIDNRSANLVFFKKNKFFALNILSFDQQGLASAFAKPGNVSKWQFAPFAMSKFGNPIFKDSLAIIECKKHRILPMGDHHILFGEVVGFYIEEDKKEMKPLSYWCGGYES